MEEDNKTTEAPAPEKKKRGKKLTTSDITRAAINTPPLSPDKFTLGDREFPILDLPYDDYVEFIEAFTPIIDMITNSQRGIPEIPGIGLGEPQSFSVRDVFKFCGKELPRLVHIICRQSDKAITVEDIKLLAKTPFQLAEIVVMQIERNRMIKDFADFFPRILRYIPK
jgi:hypothetical protein